jgi:tetratricopeptide (TPR) repeat protein/DNA-binding CsgD family transcriptional regulator
MVKEKKYFFNARLILIVLIGFIASSGVAQTPLASKIDSIKNILKKEALSLDSSAALYSKLGVLYYKSDSLILAIVNKKKAAEICLQNNDLKKYSEHLETIGILYSLINDSKQSLKYFLDALKIRDKENKKDEHYYSLIQNIGITYVEAEEVQKGIPFLMNSLNFFEKDTSSSREYLIVNYVDLGAAYGKMDIVDSAFYYYYKALAVSKKKNVSKHTGGVLVNLGDLYEKLKVYEKAKALYQEALELFKDNKDDRGYWHTIYGLAVAEKNLKNTDKAMGYLSEAVPYFKISNDLPYLRDSYKTLSEIYEGQNNIDKAFEYYKLCSEVKDSIVAGDQNSKMTELQMQYELQKTEIENTNEIALMKKENQLNLYKIYTIIGVLIIGFFFILSYVRRLQIKKKLMESQFENSQLESKHLQNEVEYKNKELENFALHIVHKNDFLETIKAGLSELKDNTDKDNLQKVKKLSFQITQSLRRNKDLEKFQERTDQVHGTFLKKLSEHFPELTEKEKRLCVLLKLNLSSKEIAILNNISENAVMMARYRMRKKMNLNSEENLTEFIKKFD